jgi:hypothetical protein
MTAKEKAKYLVDMFMNVNSNKMSDHSRMYLPTAKECALILVNELLVATYLLVNKNDLFIEYWQEVKQEIEIL